MTLDEEAIVRQLIAALEQALSVWHDSLCYPTPQESQATAKLAHEALKAAKTLSA